MTYLEEKTSINWYIANIGYFYQYGENMKTIIILTISLISSLAISCPDVSGKFFAGCSQVNSCSGSAPVAYGVEIKQNSCTEVSIAYVAWNGNSVFDINYLVDAYTNYVHKSAGPINAFVTYSSSHLYKIEKIGGIVFSQNYKKISENGQNKLEVIDIMKTDICTIVTECTLPEIK